MGKVNKHIDDRYKIIFDSSRDSIMTLEPPTWDFTSANKATIELFGVKDEAEFISSPPWKLSPQHQEDGSLSSEKAKEMIEKAMEEEVNFFEWIHKRKNGEDFYASVLLTKLKFEGKEFLQATVRDITLQKETEEALKVKIAELEKFQEVMVNRELKMVELKEELEACKKAD